MKYIFFLSLLVLCSCKRGEEVVPASKVPAPVVVPQDSVANVKESDEDGVEDAKKPSWDVADTTFVLLSAYSADFVYDLKYATKANFLKEQVYDCPACYLRFKTVKALIAANEEFKTLGYQIKIFDCYRPLDVQKKMWKILPGTNYVANPRKGSVHNRGGAVDLTLVTVVGDSVAMGTDFDFFGPQAHHSYSNLPNDVLKNRMLLKSVLRKHQFSAINSEWWHYNFKPAKQDAVSNFNWECN